MPTKPYMTCALVARRVLSLSFAITTFISKTELTDLLVETIESEVYCFETVTRLVPPFL